MTEPEESSIEDDVAVIPVDAERGLALVLGAEVIDAESWQMPRRLISDAIMVGGLPGRKDGSHVPPPRRIACPAGPQTLTRLKEGAVFSWDADGFRLGTLREEGKRGFTDQVRFLEGAANPSLPGCCCRRWLCRCS